MAGVVQYDTNNPYAIVNPEGTGPTPERKKKRRTYRYLSLLGSTSIKRKYMP
jgi:hypothetical protein